MGPECGERRQGFNEREADRFLAATARVFDLTLVTADARLLKGKGFSLMPNR